MPPTGPVEERIDEVLAGLVTCWEPLVDRDDETALQKILDFEPMEQKTLPQLSILFSGYRRANLERADVEGTPIRDPLGGRVWVFDFDVRIWLALIGDEEASQRRMRKLVPQVVVALEEDKSLGGLAVDAAMPSGITDIMFPREDQGQALLIHTCKCSVEIEETL